MYDIRLENMAGTLDVVNRLQDRFDDLRPFWDKTLTPLIIAETLQIIYTEGRGTWPDLNEAYAARKAEERPGKTMLRYDDHLIKALSSSAAEGNIFESHPSYMVWGLDPEVFRKWGNGAAYPRHHEEGIGVPRREIYSKLFWGGRFERNVHSLGEKWYADEVRHIEGRYGSA